jgi:hypothetical protein
MRRPLVLLTLLLLPALALAKPPRSRDGWVFLESADSAHMSGTMGDVRAARAQQKSPTEQLLYVRRGGRAWVIREAATLGKLRVIWGPANALGKKMEGVGKKLEAIGSRQEELGAKMEPLGDRMGELGEELARRRGDDPEVDRIRAEMDALSAKMDDLSKMMDSIAREMEPHSRELERMGDEMEKLARKAEGEMSVLIDDAIARGVAQPVDPK